MILNLLAIRKNDDKHKISLLTEFYCGWIIINELLKLIDFIKNNYG